MLYGPKNHASTSIVGIISVCGRLKMENLLLMLFTFVHSGKWLIENMNGYFLLGKHHQCEKVFGLLLIFFMAFARGGFAQGNLVLDPGFEKLTSKSGVSFYLSRRSKDGASWWTAGKHKPTVFAAPKEYVALASEGKNALGLTLGKRRIACGILGYNDNTKPCSLKAASAFFHLSLFRAGSNRSK